MDASLNAPKIWDGALASGITRHYNNFIFTIEWSLIFFDQFLSRNLGLMCSGFER
jgi:hypothetical protein